MKYNCVEHTSQESASGSWHQESEDKEEWCCDGTDRSTLILPQLSPDMSLPSAASAGKAHPLPVSTSSSLSSLSSYLFTQAKKQ